MSLVKAYENYVDNGGEIAIGAFDFQTYTGVFFMLFLHKSGQCFKIFFEKDDDISLTNLTLNKKYKIQVKSEKLTLGKLTSTKKDDPKSILGKMIFNSKEYDYIVLAFGSERGNAIKNICEEKNKNIGNTSYSIKDELYNDDKKCQKIKETLIEFNCSKEKLFFHEMPFTVEPDNCLYHLNGYSVDDCKGTLKKITMNKEQLLGMLGSIHHSIGAKSQTAEYDNKIFEEIEKQNEELNIIEGILNEIKLELGYFHYRNLEINKSEYMENKKLYADLFKNVNVPKYSEKGPFSKFLYKIAEEEFEKLNESLKKRFNIFLVEWYIIDKIITGEYMNHGIQN